MKNALFEKIIMITLSMTRFGASITSQVHSEYVVHVFYVTSDQLLLALQKWWDRSSVIVNISIPREITQIASHQCQNSNNVRDFYLIGNYILFYYLLEFSPYMKKVELDVYLCTKFRIVIFDKRYTQGII